MKKVLSIIVPIYNAEKYLVKCLDSIINQSLCEIEIICINDGSKDKSESILEKYKNNYPEKIIVVNKTNEGVYRARLTGIDLATGEYIAFVDADDYISPDYAKKLCTSAKETNADITVCSFSRVMINNNGQEHTLSKEMSKNHTLYIDKNPEDLIEINTALWNKIYKTDLLKKTDLSLSFPPKIMEDTMFLMLVFQNTKKVVLIEDCLYYYLLRKNSAMSSVTSSQIEDCKKAMIEVKQSFLKNNSAIIEVLDAIVFLHFGVSMTLKFYEINNESFKKSVQEITAYLDKHFTSWRKNKYLSLFYCLTHGFSNLKIAIMKKVYVFHMMNLFFKSYLFITKKLKIDIKW